MSKTTIDPMRREIRRLDAGGMVGATAQAARLYLEAHPNDGAVRLCYVDSLDAMARYYEALTELRRAARFGPPQKRHVVYGRFGHIHARRGSYRLAERWYRRAVESAPADATYRIFLGATLAAAGRLQEAAAVHRRARR